MVHQLMCSTSIMTIALPRTTEEQNASKDNAIVA